MPLKKLLVGTEDFKEVIDKQGYYVDKTLLIKELIDKGDKVNLFTRP
ncbi:AAA family ATPase, partial [Lachnospiraceae bacterium ZAX-1]